MKFTIEELQDAIKGLPPDGFFDLTTDNGSPAIFYDFAIDSNFEITIDSYECMDAMIGSGWMAVSSIDTLEGFNKEIKLGKVSRLRYIALV